jgi:acyl-coenzyme A synthetase/AMP-(fatty) acid ligase
MINLDYLELYTGDAIITNKTCHSYKDLVLRINYYEIILHDFINKKIAVVGDFDFESISLLLAFRNTKNVFIPIVYSTKDELSKKLTEANVDIIFTKDDVTGQYKHQIVKNETKENDQKSGLILFSSGTTGKPKMMFHQFDNLFSSLNKLSKKQRRINILLFLMFDHIGGINTLLNCIRDGSTIVIPENRSPDSVCKIIHDFNINVLPTTPTFLNLMLLSNINFGILLKSLKLITYGTERMPQVVLLKIKNALPQVKLLQTFGTSETGILKTSSKASDSLFFKIDDERYEYKIVDQILLIKSKLNVQGYLNLKSDKFDKDGWYNTGDLVITDEDDYLMIVGRVNEVINIGGLKVLPAEIEEVLMKFDNVLDCIVYGKNNSITGQVVCAKIVLDNYQATINDIELKKKIKAFCRLKLEKFKIPSKIDFVEKLEITKRFKKRISE